MFGLISGRKKAISVLIISLILMLINAFGPQQPIVGVFALLGVVGSSGMLIGPLFLPNQRPYMQTIVGSLVVLCTWSLFGSAIYYAGNITQLHMIVLVLITSITATIVGRNAAKRNSGEFETVHQKPNPQVIAALAVAIVGLGAWWSAVTGSPVYESIRSPWDVIAPTAILAIAITTLSVTAISRASSGRTAALPTIAALFFSIIAIGVTLYPLGYGFDPFIHRATVAHIAEHGTITPKPLYYIGQYALELISLHAFSLPLSLVDRLLVPVLSAAIFVGAGAVGFTLTLKKDGPTGLLALLLLPLASFIVTTPQSLAYVFTGALVLLSLPRLQGINVPLHTLGFITAAALVTHPLAGIPAAIYFVLIAVATHKSSFSHVKTVLITIISLAGAAALPLIFIAQAHFADLAIRVNPAGLLNLSQLQLEGFLSNRYSSWLDGLYLFIANQLWILILLAVIGAIVARKHGAKKEVLLPLLAATMWLINFWILSAGLEFEFLIEYERANYANRLIVITTIFLLPHVGIAIAGMFDHAKSRARSLSIGISVLLALAVMANVYGTYPRHDNYARSSGYNVGEHDIDAVYAIDELGETSQYIVLANQAVSAAALESFGFKTYYNNDIFYYPIPTGGQLYTYFLEMSEQEPTRETAYEAMDLVGVDTLYFVVNDYWWQSEKIREHAKREADDWFSVGDGSVTVFVYDRSSDEPL